jgi:predicted ATPase
VGVALGLVLLNMSRLSSRLERRMQGDMAARLASVYRRFSEGFATADLKAAKGLVDALT